MSSATILVSTGPAGGALRVVIMIMLMMRTIHIQTEISKMTVSSVFHLVLYRVPTGYLLYQENFNFRSPYVYIDNGACFVDSDGIVDHYGGWGVTNSYGRSSPSTQFDTSCFMTNRGGVFDEHNDGDSYGMIYTTNKKSTFRSPNAHYGGAYFVISDGAFGVDWYIGNSYGIFISMIYYECDIDILYIIITFLLFGGT